LIDLAKLDRPPAGFAACRECAYRDTGSAPICFTCASERSEPIAEHACRICDQELKPDGSCGNPICNWSESDRHFSFVWAITMRTGEMKRAITRYKYDGKWGWAAIFGRILVGFLNDYAEAFQRFDFITPSPSFVGPGTQRAYDHTRRIVEAAEIEEPIRWPFAYDVIVKDALTERLVGKTWQERRVIAEGELRGALRVPDPDRVDGTRVLIIDDVFTEGFTIREVARALRGAGAAEVSEIVLAREPWKGG
jgi:predicted amidophosphoribosyltransferase